MPSLLYGKDIIVGCEVNVVMLSGGNKSSQERDIEQEKIIAKDWRDEDMIEKFTRYDTAEYLKTDSDMAANLDACLEEAGDDPAFIAHALGVIARARGMSQLARDTGPPRENLYKALSSDLIPIRIRGSKTVLCGG